jgi:hypothetical protein
MVTDDFPPKVIRRLLPGTIAAESDAVDVPI